MAYPVVQDVTETTVASSSTTHNISMPATVNAGDILLTIFCWSNTAHTTTTPSGWTAISVGSGMSAFGKVASGSEDGTTVNFVTSLANTAVAQVYRLTGTYGDVSLDTIEVAQASGTSTTPNPPNLNPANWDVAETLWIAATRVSKSGGYTVSVYPSGYSNDLLTASGSNPQIAAARKESSSSSENPGTFTVDTSASWLAFTIAIRPQYVLQTIDPPVLTITPTFYGPELALQGLLIPPLLTITPVFYDHSLAYEQALSPDILTIEPVFYGPTINTTITVPLLTNSSTFYGAELINTQVLAPALFTNSPTFYGPEFRGPQNIGIPLLTNSSTFYGPEIFTVWTNTDSLTSDTWTDVDYPT